MARPVGSLTKNRRWKAAFHRLYDASPDKLDDLALTAHKAAQSGDIQAMAFIRDTMDGKPAQAIVGSDEDPAVKIDNRIELVIVDPKEEGMDDGNIQDRGRPA